MVKKIVKSFCGIGLSLILLSNSVVAVTGTVTGNNVRIREKADPKSLEITVATKNEKVDVIGEEGNWYKVNFGNVTGYMSKDYIDTNYSSGNNDSTTEEQNNSINSSVDDNVNNSQNTETLDSISNTQTQNYEINQIITLDKDIELRYLPSFTSRVSVNATNGSTYTIKNSLNNWVKLVNETNSGWILKANIENSKIENEILNDANENMDENIEQQTSSTNISSKGKVNVDSARLRKSPNGDVLDSISKGTEVTILGEENDWYHIKTNDYESCYIAKRLITKN